MEANLEESKYHMADNSPAVICECFSDKGYLCQEDAQSNLNKESLNFQDSLAYSLMYLYLGASGPDPSIEICWESKISLLGNLVTLTISDLQSQKIRIL